MDYLRFPAAGVEAEASTFVLPEPPSPCAAAVGAAVLQSLLTSQPSMDSLPGLISPSEEEMLAAFSYDEFSPSPHTTSSPPASPPSPANADAIAAAEDAWSDCDGDDMDSPPLKADTTSMDAATEAGSSIYSSSVSENELEHVLPASGLPPSPVSARTSSPDEAVVSSARMHVCGRVNLIRVCVDG